MCSFGGWWRFPPFRLLALLAFDVIDGVFDGLDFFRVFVWNVEVKCFFKGHDELDDVETVGAEVVNKRRRAVHLGFIHAELFYYDLLYLLLNRHESLLVDSMG